MPGTIEAPLPPARAAIWLQRRHVPALDGAVLAWQLDADLASPARLRLALELGDQLQAPQLMTEAGADGVVQTLARAEVLGWAEAALPGRWVRLAGVDAAMDGRWRVLARGVRFDLVQGLVSTLRLQRG